MMILRSLKLTNFRQFSGSHLIVFATPKAVGTSVMTVISGPGGSGKTSIVRALWFGLFGKTCLPGDTSSTPQQLVSLEAFSSRRTEAVVEVVFEHQQTHYTIHRTMVGWQEGGKMVEEPGAVLLTVLPPGGESETINDFSQVTAVVAPQIEHVLLDLGIAGEGMLVESSTMPGRRTSSVWGDMQQLSVGQGQLLCLQHALKSYQKNRPESDYLLITDGTFDLLDASSRDAFQRLAQQCGQVLMLKKQPQEELGMN